MSSPRIDADFLGFRGQRKPLDSLRVIIGPSLAQDQLSRAALPIGYENYLRVHHLRKIIVTALWKYLDFPLPRRLRHYVIAVACNREYEIRSKLATSHISIEQLGINRGLFVLFYQRNACVGQVSPDDIHAGVP